MKTETEVIFLDADHQAIRDKLNKLGAVCEKPMRLMRRTIMDFPDNRLHNADHAWVRVRDEGDQTTLTYKRTVQDSIDGAEEIEVPVGSYESTVEFLQAIGLSILSTQESKRETWRVSGLEVVLDLWPWVSPTMEIEGEDPDAIQKLASQLGLDWNKATFGGATSAYKAEYPKIADDETVAQISEIRFDRPVPEWLIKRK